MFTKAKMDYKRARNLIFLSLSSYVAGTFKSNHFNIPLDALNSGNVLIQKHDIYLDLNR